MILATWNVNSLNVRLGHVIDWLNSNPVDVLCLQELKLDQDKFPLEAIQQIGYEAIWHGQKTYNGVAILSKTIGTDVKIDIPNLEDPQKRLIAATYNDIRIICAYMPNGQEVGSDKFHYKMAWLSALHQHLKETLIVHPKLALLGDFNIAPQDDDVHDPAAWIGQILVSPEERQHFQNFLQLGLHDSFRLFQQEPKQFSWWDYRMLGFQKNKGMRIDHILLSDALAKSCSRAWIDRAPRKWEKPSDHTPVLCEIA